MSSENLSLFDEIVTIAPPTEGIKYAGSKLKLLPHILQMAKKTGAKSILDGFAGTTRVSQAFAKSGYNVICNDIAPWSQVFGTCYLLSKEHPRYYKEMIAHLNSCAPMSGWFTENYGGSADSQQEHSLMQKRPWQIHNTMKLDAIRSEIEAMQLNRIDKAVALTSLILALDQVDSTLGHFASYLKEWSPRSYKEIVLKVPLLFQPANEHQVYQSDIFHVAQSVTADLAYYDPPYGSNNEKMPPSRVRYAAYYHVWASVCRDDRPKLFGKVNRRSDTSDKIAATAFEEFRKNEMGQFVAVQAIRRLLSVSRAPWMILSYSSAGRATSAELNQVISESGKLAEVIEIDYKKNVMANMTWTNEWLREADEPNREFLFLIERV